MMRFTKKTIGKYPIYMRIEYDSTKKKKTIKHVVKSLRDQWDSIFSFRIYWNMPAKQKQTYTHIHVFLFDKIANKKHIQKQTNV